MPVLELELSFLNIRIGTENWSSLKFKASGIKQSSFRDGVFRLVALGRCQQTLQEAQILGRILVDPLVVYSDLAVHLADLKIIKTVEREIDFRQEAEAG